MKTNVIHENKWVSLMERTLDNGSKYVYTSEPWCDSEGVAILIFRQADIFDKDGGKYDILGRYEICPAHSDIPELCSFTGGMDKHGMDELDVAVAEVKEEAGYTVSGDDLTYLGTVKPSKASDKTMTLFAVDVTGLEQGEAIGDGTVGEEGSYTTWVNIKKATWCKDPLMSTMMMRLMI